MRLSKAQLVYYCYKNKGKSYIYTDILSSIGPEENLYGRFEPMDNSKFKVEKLDVWQNDKLRWSWSHKFEPRE